MKCISFGPSCALMASLLIGAPLGFAQTEVASNASEPLRLTVAPNTPSRIAMKTLAKSTCLLHAEGDNDAEILFYDLYRTQMIAANVGFLRLVESDGSSKMGIVIDHEAIDIIRSTQSKRAA